MGCGFSKPNSYSAPADSRHFRYCVHCGNPIPSSEAFCPRPRCQQHSQAPALGVQPPRRTGPERQESEQRIGEIREQRRDREERRQQRQVLDHNAAYDGPSSRIDQPISHMPAFIPEDEEMRRIQGVTGRLDRPISHMPVAMLAMGPQRRQIQCLGEEPTQRRASMVDPNRISQRFPVERRRR